MLPLVPFVDLKVPPVLCGDTYEEEDCQRGQARGFKAAASRRTPEPPRHIPFAVSVLGPGSLSPKPRIGENSFLLAVELKQLFDQASFTVCGHLPSPISKRRLRFGTTW